MAQANTRAGRFQTLIGGIVLAGAIMTACTSPLSQHVNSVWLAMAGFMLAGAFFAFYQLAVRPTLDPGLKKVAWAMAGIGIAGLAWTFADAIVTAQDYEVVCEAQQQRMMGGDSAGAEIFRALKCDFAR
jgi:drug/metabolite transporter (DMT)-like permease